MVPIQISTCADSFSEIYELNRSLSVTEMFEQFVKFLQREEEQGCNLPGLLPNKKAVAMAAKTHKQPKASKASKVAQPTTAGAARSKGIRLFKLAGVRHASSSSSSTGNAGRR